MKLYNPIQSNFKLIFLCRYLAICRTWSFDLTRRKTALVITFIWTFAVLVYSPWVVVHERHLWHDNATYVCEAMWSKTAQKVFFIGVNFLTSYTIPLLLISAFYAQICRRVWNRKAVGESANEAVHNTRVKVVKMLLVVVVLFALSWLPLYVINMRVMFWQFDAASPDFDAVTSFVLPLAQWLGLANSCVNPLVYCFFSRN